MAETGRSNRPGPITVLETNDFLKLFSQELRRLNEPRNSGILCRYRKDDPASSRAGRPVPCFSAGICTCSPCALFPWFLSTSCPCPSSEERTCGLPGCARKEGRDGCVCGNGIRGESEMYFRYVNAWSDEVVGWEAPAQTMRDRMISAFNPNARKRCDSGAPGDAACVQISQVTHP